MGQYVSENHFVARQTATMCDLQFLLFLRFKNYLHNNLNVQAKYLTFRAFPMPQRWWFQFKSTILNELLLTALHDIRCIFDLYLHVSPLNWCSRKTPNQTHCQYHQWSIRPIRVPILQCYCHALCCCSLFTSARLFYFTLYMTWRRHIRQTPKRCTDGYVHTILLYRHVFFFCMVAQL